MGKVTVKVSRDKSDLGVAMSQDANDLACGLFMRGQNQETVFHMVKYRPSERCQDALIELHGLGYLMTEPVGEKGTKYIPTDKMRITKWAMPTRDSGLMITERI